MSPRWTAFAIWLALLAWMVAGCGPPTDQFPAHNTGVQADACLEVANRSYSEGYRQGRSDERSGMELLPVRPHEQEEDDG